MNDKIIRKKVCAELTKGGECTLESYQAAAWLEGYRFYCLDRGCNHNPLERYSVGKLYKSGNNVYIEHAASFTHRRDAIIFATSLYCAERYREMKAIENELNELSSFEEWAMGETTDE